MLIKVEKIGRYGVFTTDIPKKLEAALYNKLAYQRDGWQFMPNPAWSWVRFYHRKKKCFPWGLRDRVVVILSQWHYYSKDDYEVNCGPLPTDTRKPIGRIPNLRPYQLKAVNKLVIQGGGILSMPTGSGKTRTAIEFLKHMDFETGLVVVHTIDLRNQWQDRLTAAGLGMKILVATFQSIKGDTWNRHLKHTNVVVFDECHHVPAKSIYKVAMRCHNATVVGLSATPYRSVVGEEIKIEAALGQIVYQIGTRTLINRGYLCDAEVSVIDLEQDPVIEFWDTYHEVYNDWIVTNGGRNDMITKIAFCESRYGLVMILVDKIEHGNYLLSVLEGTKIECIFVHGKSKKRAEIFEDVKAGKYKIVIATKIYSEGVDIPRLKTLIMAGGGKSSVKIIQQIGRLLRLFPNKGKAQIYDFADSAKYLVEHYKARRKIYNELFEVNEYGRKNNTQTKIQDCV